jgi:hypothetical protein
MVSTLNVYLLSSMLLTAGVVTHVALAHKQFFPTMLYLASSKGGSLVRRWQPRSFGERVADGATDSWQVLGNIAVVITIFLGQVLKRIFLGELRDTELEVRFTLRLGRPPRTRTSAASTEEDDGGR